MSEVQKTAEKKPGNGNTSAGLQAMATVAKERKTKKKAVRLKDVASGAAGVRWSPRHSNQILDRISRNIGTVPAAHRKLVTEQAIDMLRADLEGGEVVIAAASTQSA